MMKTTTKIDLKSFTQIFSNKKVRYGGYAAVIIVFVLAALVVLNVLVGQIPTSIDMTHNKLYTLSKETKKLVEGLKQPVTIYAVYRTGQTNPQVTAVLKKYSELSGKLKVDYVDPDTHPALLAKYSKNNQSISAGSLIITSGNYDRVLSPYDLYDISYTRQGQPQILGFTMEQKVTSAISYVTSGLTPEVYEITGHGEDTLSRLGLNTVLDRNNYKINKLDLLKDPAVPKNAAVVVDISPKYDLNKSEETKLINYIDGGGRAMFFFDLTSTMMNNQMPVYEDLLSNYGVGLVKGIILEGSKSHYANSPNILLPVYGSNKTATSILKPLTDNNLQMFVPNSLAIKELIVKNRGTKIIPLLTSSKDSFIRTDLSNNSANKIASDLPGPADIAVAIQQETNNPNTNPGYRLLVAGDAQFLGQISLLGQIKGNVEFFTSALSWVTNRPNSVNISSKSLFKLPLQMSNVLLYLYMAIVVILIPALILGIGITMWLRRRHL